MLDILAANSSLTHAQSVAILFLPRLLLYPAEHSIVGGESLGCIIAHEAAVQLETCAEGLRAVFWVDARSLLPMEIGSGSEDFLKTQGRQLAVGNAWIAIQCASLPRMLSRVRCLDFVCQLTKIQ